MSLVLRNVTGNTGNPVIPATATIIINPGPAAYYPINGERKDLIQNDVVQAKLGGTARVAAKSSVAPTDPTADVTAADITGTANPPNPLPDVQVTIPPTTSLDQYYDDAGNLNYRLDVGGDIIGIRG